MSNSVSIAVRCNFIKFCQYFSILGTAYNVVLKLLLVQSDTIMSSICQYFEYNTLL